MDNHHSNRLFALHYTDDGVLGMQLEYTYKQQLNESEEAFKQRVLRRFGLDTDALGEWNESVYHVHMSDVLLFRMR